MNGFLEHRQANVDGRRKKLIKKGAKRVQQISLIVLIWMCGLGSVYALYHAIIEKGLFKVKNIEVEGAFVHVSKEEVLRAAGVELNSNIYKADINEVQKRLQKNPWIKESSVTRKLPSTLWIYVGEYEPVAILLGDKSLQFVDSFGVSFKSADAREEKDLPVVTGADSQDEVSDALNILKLYMDSRLSALFSPAEIHYDSIKGYSIVLAGLGLVLRVGSDQITEKLERFYSLLGTISSYKDKMRYVDLNIPGKIVVKYDS